MIRPIPCRLCGAEVETSETDIHGRCYRCVRDDVPTAQDAELSALRAEVERLTRERDEWKRCRDELATEHATLYQSRSQEMDRAETAEAEAAALREGLGEILASTATLDFAPGWMSARERAVAAFMRQPMPARTTTWSETVEDMLRRNETLYRALLSAPPSSPRRTP